MLRASQPVAGGAAWATAPVLPPRKAPRQGGKQLILPKNRYPIKIASDLCKEREGSGKKKRDTQTVAFRAVGGEREAGTDKPSCPQESRNPGRSRDVESLGAWLSDGGEREARGPPLRSLV
jgi:hypothetical protein